HASGVCAGTHWNSEFEHLSHGWSPLGGFLAVTIHKVFALICHAVLNRDTASQGFDAFQVFVGNSFAMVEEPVQTFERDIAIDLLKNIQKARDAFVVGGVKTERPFVSSQQRDDTF